MATQRRWCSIFALTSEISSRSKSAHELRRPSRLVSDRGAQAGFSVTLRLGVNTVLWLEPQPVRLIPQCSSEGYRA